MSVRLVCRKPGVKSFKIPLLRLASSAALFHHSPTAEEADQDQDFIISMVGSKMLEISRLASKIPDSITIVLD